MLVHLAALSIGAVAGLRTMMAPAAVCWAAWLGWIDLEGSWLAFLGYRYSPWILTVLALGELVADKLPSTPSRKVSLQFGARIVSGALCGAALGMGLGAGAVGGAFVGAVGAVAGTLAGAAARARLAATFGRDRPAALIEDAVAILGAAIIVGSLS